MVELGIVDIRELVKLIKNNYNFDFSALALTSLKYRIEHVIAKNQLPSAESLYRKLSDQPEFFDLFMNQVCVPSTEMFRDPSLWRWLRESYFAQLEDKHLLNFKIWLPYCVSGGELFTMAIFLKELNLLNKVKIIASSFSKTSIDQIKLGEYPLKKMEISKENYKRFILTHEFPNYFTEDNYKAKRDVSLIKDVEFILDDFNFSKAPQNIRLIFLRNVMIYFNPSHQEKMLQKMHESLSATGKLFVGLKENILGKQYIPDLFEPANISESVYNKKIV